MGGMGGSGIPAAALAAALRAAGCGTALALLALTLGAAPASAQESPADPFGRGRVQLGMRAGYSVPYELHDDAEVKQSEFVALLPRASIGLGDPIGGERGGGWLEGQVELVAELSVLLQVEPRSGYAVGGALLGRYDFLAWRPLVPFVEAGAGITELQFDLFGQDDGFSFTLQGGAGLQWWLAPRAAITAEWRYHHISNAGIRNPNVGIDSNLFLIGATFFLR